MLSAERRSSILTFIKDLVVRTKDDDLAGLAAQLAYFFLLSLFPALFFIITLFGYLPIETQDVLEFLRQYAPVDAMELIETNVEKIVGEQNGGLLSFGLLATLWAASNAINAIMRAFNRAYDIKETRPFYITRGLAIVLTIGMVFVIMFALFIPVFGKVIGNAVLKVFGLSHNFLHVWSILRLLFSFLVILIIFSFLYKLAPNRKLKPMEVISGALFATGGWITVSYLFAYYVDNFGNYSTTYGSIGGIIILMLWFYLTGWVVLLGGEINALLNCYRTSGKDSHYKKP
nr:YihY/virulence factor BrkB family protein [Bacillus sp. 165]